MMETAIQYSIYTIGFLFCIMVLCGLILFFIDVTIKGIKRRKTIELKLRIASYTSELSRWCGYEFPQVKETADAIWQLTNGDGYPSADQFREKLRNKVQGQKEKL